MTMLLAFVTVAALGTWIPLAQLLPGVPQRSRIFYVAVGNLAVAAIALLAGGGRLELGWRGFWLPLAGGAVWTAGNYCAFRASETIGLARAAGTWTPLNIIVAFAWGALLFGELDHFSGTRFAILGVALLAVLAGVLLIVSSQGSPATPPSPRAAMAAEPGPGPDPVARSRRGRPAGTGHRSRRARAAARSDRREEPAGSQVHPHPAPPRRASRPRRPRRRAATRLLHRPLASRGAGVTLNLATWDPVRRAWNRAD